MSRETDDKLAEVGQVLEMCRSLLTDIVRRAPVVKTFVDDQAFILNEINPALVKLHQALTARSDGFREGVERSSKMCEESAKILLDKGLRQQADALSITAKSIATLSPRETDAKVGHGWIPEDALSFCEDCGMYVISKPPPPERP